MLIFYPANFILDQWNKIIEQLGTPSQDFMRRLQEHILTIKKTIILIENAITSLLLYYTLQWR